MEKFSKIKHLFHNLLINWHVLQHSIHLLHQYTPIHTPYYIKDPLSAHQTSPDLLHKSPSRAHPNQLQAHPGQRATSKYRTQKTERKRKKEPPQTKRGQRKLLVGSPTNKRICLPCVL